MDVSFPCTFVPGNETTTQWTFVPGSENPTTPCICCHITLWNINVRKQTISDKLEKFKIWQNCGHEFAEDGDAVLSCRHGS